MNGNGRFVLVTPLLAMSYSQFHPGFSSQEREETGGGTAIGELSPRLSSRVAELISGWAVALGVANVGGRRQECQKGWSVGLLVWHCRGYDP